MEKEFYRKAIDEYVTRKATFCRENCLKKKEIGSGDAPSFDPLTIETQSIRDDLTKWRDYVNAEQPEFKYDLEIIRQNLTNLKNKINLYGKPKHVMKYSKGKVVQSLKRHLDLIDRKCIEELDKLSENRKEIHEG